uniref:Histone-lysine N-methyltransferase SETDB2 n=1 Tax=Neolamprologus brichardi TaxID=32507 RepID=A0A3Q4I6K7_NEOBR
PDLFFPEKAKAFWNNEDVDQVFDVVFKYLEHLKAVLKRSGTTDKGSDPCLMRAIWQSSYPDLYSLSSLRVCPGLQAARASGLLLLLGLPPGPGQLGGSGGHCMTQSMPLFWGQNPLKIPLLCGFKRLTAMPLISPEQEDVGNWDVIYKAPCGLSLRNHDNVMLFLEATESYDILQVDFFTFNPSVRLDPPSPGGLRQPEQDLSRGAEPIPVELCVGDGGSRPAEFRYRKDRWPHGCFLSRGPKLFKACCDCTDGCSDAKRCACVALTSGERHYRHHRLLQANPSGLFECGPWCGCDRSRCQNRLVQRGIRVRLQVFQTENRGWGVRCRDDLDRGTFVCIYAGVVLQRVPNPTEPPPPKLTRSDLPSDDEVEVVTEWLAPPVLEGRRNVLETPPPTSPPTSPLLHVPVIQRPSDSGSSTTDQEEVLAGTELTWDYSANVQIDSLQKQEVSCLCESDNCHGRFTIEENLCDVCEVKGHIAMEAE